MKLATLVLLLLAALALYCIICRCSGREKFFGGLDTFTVNWQPPSGYMYPANISYNWIICPAGATGININDPTSWSASSGSVISNTVSTTASITQSVCPTCDFGQTLLFAVQALDTNFGLASPWLITPINLAGNVTGATLTLSDEFGSPLMPGGISFGVSLTLQGPIPQYSSVQAYITVSTSGGDYVTNSIIVDSPTVIPGPYTVQGMFADPSIWSLNPNQVGSTLAGPPGALQAGDVVTACILATEPDDKTVYYYGCVSASIENPPPPPAPTSISSPSSVSWSIA